MSRAGPMRLTSVHAKRKSGSSSSGSGAIEEKRSRHSARQLTPNRSSVKHTCKAAEQRWHTQEASNRQTSGKCERQRLRQNPAYCSPSVSLFDPNPIAGDGHSSKYNDAPQDEAEAVNVRRVEQTQQLTAQARVERQGGGECRYCMRRWEVDVETRAEKNRRENAGIQRQSAIKPGRGDRGREGVSK